MMHLEAHDIPPPMEMMKNFRNVLVVYHNHCDDGFSAAMCAYFYFKATEIMQTQFIAGNYDDPAQIEFIHALLDSDTFMYIVDFSFKPDVLARFCSKAKHVVMLDHHKTAQEDIINFKDQPVNLDICFDMTKSGAGLAWRHFFPKADIPYWIAMMQDQDLYRHEIPDTRDFIAGIRAYPRDFAVWKQLFDPMDSQVYKLIQDGAAINKARQEICRQHMPFAFIVKKENYSFIVVNASWMFGSELGEMLLAKYPEAEFSIVWTFESPSRIKMSLRSRKDNSFDVSALARKYGGGGHAQAAGFYLNGLLHLEDYLFQGSLDV